MGNSSSKNSPDAALKSKLDSRQKIKKHVVRSAPIFEVESKELHYCGVGEKKTQAGYMFLPKRGERKEEKKGRSTRGA